MRCNLWMSRHQTEGYQGSSSLGQKRSHQQLGYMFEQETLAHKKQAIANYQNGPRPVMQRMYVPPMANISNPLSASGKFHYLVQRDLLRPLGHSFSTCFGDHLTNGRATTDVLGKLQSHVGGMGAVSRQNLYASTRIKKMSNNRFPGTKHPCIKFTFRGRQVERSSQNWKIMASEFDEDGEGFFSVGPCLHEPHQVNIPTEPERKNAKLESCAPNREGNATENDKVGGGLEPVTLVGCSHKEADTRLILSTISYDKNHVDAELSAAYEKRNQGVAMTASAPGGANLLDGSANDDPTNKAVQKIESAHVNTTLTKTQRGTALTGPCANFPIINSSDIQCGRQINNPSTNASSADTRKVAEQTDFGNSSSSKVIQIARYDNASSTDHVNPDSTSNLATKAVTTEENNPRSPAAHFPVNVKSLLATGVFDGICIKYVSWDRKKSVRGTIKGAGYLCWCKECNATKIVNAFEFEMHAGCKSKHPNDHIYFPNGKNIYSVVQELRSISSDKLPEAIRTITGTNVDEINFSIRKC